MSRINIKEAIVASGHGPLNARMFAVHSTANVGATAANHVAYWSGAGAANAVHLVSDWNEAYHCVPYGSLCWQVGNGNYLCEGIEICEADNWDDFMRGIVIAADVVAQRLEAHGWSVDDMHSHKWFSEVYGGSDHVDPIPYFERWGYSWEKWVSAVAANMSVKIIETTGEDDDMSNYARFRSAEKYIENMYDTLLCRKADSAGLYTWLDAYCEGMTLLEIANEIIGCPEWLSMEANSSRARIAQFYLCCLGRLPEESGMDHWVQVAEEDGLRVVFESIFNSGESQSILKSIGLA